MFRFLKYAFFLLLFMCFTPSSGTELVKQETDECRRLYRDMGLSQFVGYDAFNRAYAGYNKISGKRKSILTLIDFTKPSTEKRLYVLDMDRLKVLFVSYVAHGRNSGDNYATSFSNKNGSNKSSLGFYLTENTYNGRNGYSLVLNGLEKGVNDKAKERSIVIHGASYSNPSVITSSGRLGRSLGCPALPEEINEVIINTIKDGSLLFIYSDDKNYLSRSTILSEMDVSAKG